MNIMNMNLQEANKRSQEYKYEETEGYILDYLINCDITLRLLLF